MGRFPTRYPRSVGHARQIRESTNRDRLDLNPVVACRIQNQVGGVGIGQMKGLHAQVADHVQRGIGGVDPHVLGGVVTDGRAVAGVTEQFAVGPEGDVADHFVSGEVTEGSNVGSPSVLLTREGIDDFQARSGIDVQQHVIERVGNDRIAVEQQWDLGRRRSPPTGRTDVILGDTCNRVDRLQPQQWVDGVGLEELAQLARYACLIGDGDVSRYLRATRPRR